MLNSESYDSDPAHHGTRVASLIAGGMGLGTSSDSSVRVYGLGKGNASIAEVGMAIGRACAQGNKIINVSMGSDGMGIFQTSLSSEIPPQIQLELERMGCLIVHAAGNDGGMKRSSSSPFEFEIGANTKSDEPAAFSNSSDFRMPGQNVIGVEKKDVNKDVAEGCQLDNQSFASGTSFAAPLFSGTLADVRDVLMQSSRFSKLPPLYQARLLREVMQNSVLSRNVNAYLAVRIADVWVKNPSLDIDGAKSKLFDESEASCKLTGKPCASDLSCKDASKCLSDLRSKASLCPIRKFEKLGLDLICTPKSEQINTKLQLHKNFRRNAGVSPFNPICGLSKL